MESLPINEIFYSLQGEGAQTGKAMIFIRLAGCNLHCSYCDTDFSVREILSLQQLLARIEQFPSTEILWTGGEPLLRLNGGIVQFFKKAGYRQSIETNGTIPTIEGLDYITCSPKPEAFSKLHINFPNGVDEWRFPFGEGIPLPPEISNLPPATNYYVSPIFDLHKAISQQQSALLKCIAFVLEHPKWQMSVQTHKLVGFR